MVDWKVLLEVMNCKSLGERLLGADKRFERKIKKRNKNFTMG